MSAAVPDEVREARRAQGLGLDEVARRSGVGEAEVGALERGDFGLFAGRVHAKAAVRAVAKTLSLDPEPLLRWLDDSWPPPAAPPPLQAAPLFREAPRSPAPDFVPPAPEAPAAPLVPEEPSVPRPGTREGGARRVLLWLVGVLLAALLAAGIAWTVARLAGAADGEAVSLADFAGQPAIAADAPSRGASATAGPRGAAAAGGRQARGARDPSDTPLQVLNASGQPEALNEVVTLLRALGYDVVSSGVARDLRPRGLVYFNEGWRDEARLLAEAEPRLGEVHPNDRGLDTGLALHVIIGQDWLGRG